MSTNTGWSRAGIISVVLYVLAGIFLIRWVARWQRARRRQTLMAIDGTLGELAARMGGEFRPGAILQKRHPLLGEIREYGVAEVKSGSMRATVGVNFPADEQYDDRTWIRIAPPDGRRWGVETLRMRAAPPSSELGAVVPAPAVFDRSFEATPGEGLSPSARAALMRLGAQAAELELRDGALRVIAGGGGSPVTDVAKLRALVEETADVAAEMLAGGPR